jgi:hypothetical protein
MKGLFVTPDIWVAPSGIVQVQRVTDNPAIDNIYEDEDGDKVVEINKAVDGAGQPVDPEMLEQIMEDIARREGVTEDLSDAD